MLKPAAKNMTVVTTTNCRTVGVSVATKNTSPALHDTSIKRVVPVDGLLTRWESNKPHHRKGARVTDKTRRGSCAHELRVFTHAQLPLSISFGGGWL